MKDTKKTEKDLIKSLADNRAALRDFRFGTSGSKNKNVKEGQNLKREIARALTELRAQELKSMQ